MIKENPIIFSGPMVKAILEGRKTQTRRVIKPQPPNDAAAVFGDFSFGKPLQDRKCPYGQPGDRLWVREAFEIDWVREAFEIDDVEFSNVEPYKWGYKIAYKADGEKKWCHSTRRLLKRIGPKPPIHMPRWASRINLEITAVRVEQLQKISIDDAIAEAIVADYHGSRSEAINLFKDYWNALNAKRGHRFEQNPWVWVIEFKEVENHE